MTETKAILSIDGGGIRGIIPALVLAHIEQQTGAAIADLFDVVAGTSTGGILALGLTCPGPDGRPRYSAQDLAAVYEDEGSKIFPHEFLGIVRQLFRPKYPSRGRREVLSGKLGDARLKDALAEVIVTAYDIQVRRPVFFRKALAVSEPASRDFPIWEVAMATSAAPTYFEPVRMYTEAKDEMVLVDGGVFANNPAMCAFVDRTTVGGDTGKALMVSLGTGALTHPHPYAQARRWGLIGWGPHILDVVFDGVSESVEYELGTILGAAYHRFQIELTAASDRMDDVGPPNIARLKEQAGELIASRRDELDAVCRRLAERAAR